MDLEIKIKEEPAWLEGTGNASLENIEHVGLLEMITLKNEAKSEITEPGPTQDNSFEHSEDIKKEVFIEQHTVGQLVPYIKEETKSSPEVSYGDHPHPDGEGHLERHDEDRPFICDHCGMLFNSGSSLSVHALIHMDQAHVLRNLPEMLYEEEQVDRAHAGARG
ncbi:uncharacterized protein [Anabrus simplex]|uniref:uncharacterized protein n=1 Tax=Anabrus simplex TaxID=316456 RepID=UPI0035A30D32